VVDGELAQAVGREMAGAARAHVGEQL